MWVPRPSLRPFVSSLLAITASAALLTPPAAGPAAAAASADLALRVTATSFQVGRDTMYTIAVTNNGPSATDDEMHVTTTLPNGLSFLTNRGVGWTCTAVGQAVDCVRSTSLSAGTSSSLVISISVCTAAFPSVTTAFRVAYAGDTNAANNNARRTTVVKSGVCANTPTPTRTLPGPSATRTPTLTFTPTHTPVPSLTDVSIQKFVSGTFVVGRNGLYFMTIRNLGGVATTSPITVTDVLPTGLGFVSASGSGWTCSVNGAAVTCTFSGPLPAGSSTMILLTVSIARAAYPSVTNTATVAYAGDTNPANNISRRPTSMRLLPQRPGSATNTPVPTATPTRTPSPTAGATTQTDLSLSKSTVGPFTVGSTGTYVLTVSNLGVAATSGLIRITDTLPTGLSLVAGDGCAANGQIVTCDDALPLPASGVRSVTLRVAVAAAAFPSVTNSATVMYSGDTNNRNNTATRPTTIRR